MDCLRHNLSLAKLEAYGVGNDSLNFLLDYLTFRKQRIKVGYAYSKWSGIRRGIPQGLILGLILLNIFINDIFIIIEQSAICNFAYDNSLYLGKNTHGKSDFLYKRFIILVCTF